MKTIQINKRLFVFFFGLFSLLLGAGVSYSETPAQMEQSFTVCRSGCDYSSIQAAVDDPAFEGGSRLLIMDAVFTEADIRISKDLILQGKGPDETILQAHEVYGEAEWRVLSVLDGASVVIEGLTIRHGNPIECPMYGGGIYSEGSLTLINCHVEDNISSAGGGIMANGFLDIRRSVIRRNSTTSKGGASSCGGSGGGLMFTKGQARIEKSAIYDNVSLKGKGGGIFISCAAVIEINNTTISQNQAGASGGGIFLRGKVSLENCTIAENEAATNGGGVYTRGDLEIITTIVSGNLASSEKLASDCVVGDEGFISTNQNNLISSGECEPLLQGDAGLEDLDEKGLDIPGYPLLAHSQALDVVLPAECSLSSDQRGQPRMEGENCDLGALETQPQEKNRQTRVNWALFIVQFLILIVLLLIMRKVRILP